LQRDGADAPSYEQPMVRAGPEAATTKPSLETVLLVEDNEINQLVASRMLAKLGFAAEIASSGVEALDAIAQKKYRLVFMDCQMPIMDGYEATMRLRRRERESGGGDHLVVIAMTAAAMEGDRERCLRAGMDDYISKPLTLAALREVADRSRARSATTNTAPPTKSVASGVDSSPSIDVARIRELQELDAPDGAYVEQLVAAFVENAERTVQTLRDAVQEGDPQAVERAAHALKGSSANIGATRLAELARVLETLGRGGALGKTNDAVDAAAAELELLNHALREALTAS
jgi:CheY-like chemotaxis protein